VDTHAVHRAVAALQQRAADDGFRVSRRASKIAGGGYGLFLTGAATRGDVVALYPGRYYPPPPLWAVSCDGPGAITCPPLQGDTGSFDAAIGDNSYCMHVFPHGGFLDAEDGHRYAARHPFALGHLANHPPAGQRPNVAVVAFLWRDVAEVQDRNQRAETHQYLHPVPNEMKAGFWFLDPATGDAVNLSPTVPTHAELLCGCALVALDDLEGGSHDSEEGSSGPGIEIILDYALQPPFPPWYRAVVYTRDDA
jgi:hypothetical protein